MSGKDDEELIERVTITYTRTVSRGMSGLNSPDNPWNEPLPPQDSRFKTFILNVTAGLVASAIWAYAGAAVVGLVVGLLL